MMDHCRRGLLPSLALIVFYRACHSVDSYTCRRDLLLDKVLTSTLAFAFIAGRHGVLVFLWYFQAVSTS
jgi:hypothetical protein